MIIAEIFRNASTFIVTSFAIYYFKYVLDNQAFLSVFILAISVAALFGTFAAAWIGVKIGKRSSYWLFLVLATVSYASAKLWEGTLWSFTAIFSIGYMLNMAGGEMRFGKEPIRRIPSISSSLFRNNRDSHAFME